MANIKKVMRLNALAPVKCSFCQVQVNPYVIQKKKDDWFHVECPNCEGQWNIRISYGPLSQPIILTPGTSEQSIKDWLSEINEQT